MALSSTLFTPVKKSIVIQRKTDILTTIEVTDISKVTALQMSEAAAKQPTVPHYEPDGAGAILIFHTDNGVFLLGGVRNNPALEKETTKDNTAYPQQINSTIGGYLANPELTFKDAVLDIIKTKMFLKAEISESVPGFEAQQILKELCKVVENNEGWENKVCVHTDQWENKDTSIGTMCYLTAIKHIHCTDADLIKIDEALQTIMAVKKNEGVNPRTLSAFKFVSLKPIIENSIATHLEGEITKAKKAYETFGDAVVVTFNDLAVATLARNGAFQSTQSAQLALSDSAHRKTF